jgi:hypothetical protein
MSLGKLFSILAVIVALTPVDAVAGPKQKGMGPPGLAKNGSPPGLAKKGGLPPGIAKKYAVGQRLPRDIYLPIEPQYGVRLPYNSPQGRQWVRVGRDLYLLSAATGTIVDIVENWLD